MICIKKTAQLKKNAPIALIDRQYHPTIMNFL